MRHTLRWSAFILALTANIAVALHCRADALMTAPRSLEIVPNVGHESSLSVQSLAVSPDGKRLLSGSLDETAKLWQIPSGRLIRTFRAPNDGILRIAFSADGRDVVAVTRDKALAIWDCATGQVKARYPLSGHEDDLTAVALSVDSRYAASASNDKLLLWDVNTGTRLRDFAAESVNAIAFSPDGHVLISSGGNEIVVFDTETGRPLRTLKGHSDSVASLGVSPDGNLILSGSRDDTLRIWSLATGQLLRTIKAGISGVDIAGFSPDGGRVVASGYEGTKVWRANGDLVATLEGGGWAHAMVILTDGTVAISATSELGLWDIAGGKKLRSFEGAESYVQGVAAFSPDGGTIMSAGNDTIRLWSSTDGTRVADLESGHVVSAQFSADSQKVLTAGKSQAADLWSVKGEHIRSFRGHHNWVLWAALSADGARALTGSDDVTVKLWDTETGKVVRTYEGLAIAGATSPEGTLMLWGTVEGRIELRDVQTGRLIQTFNGHSGSVRSIAFSPDQTQILSTSEDTTINVWDATTGRLIRTLEGHGGEVYSGSYSRDGRRVLSASADGTIRLWDVDSGKVKTFNVHADRVTSAAFSQDETRIASASWDHTWKLSSVDSGELLATTFASKSEWITFTPEGFFDASKNGAALVSFVRGLAVVPVDRLYESLHRPDLLREKIAGDLNGRVKEAAAKLDLR